MLKKCLFPAIVLICAFICALALLITPNRFVRNQAQNNDIVQTFDLDDIVGMNSCYVSDDGTVQKNGFDPYIVINGFNYQFQTVVLNLDKEAEAVINAMLYFDSGSNYNEKESTLSTALIGEEKIVFSLPNGNYEGIRIDIDEEYVFGSVELHSQETYENVIYVKVSPWIYIVSAFISLVLAALAVFFDKKFKISDAIIVFFKKNIKTILIGVIVFCCTAIVAFALEYFIGKFIVGIASNRVFFNIRRFIFILGVIFSVAYLFMCRKIAAQKFENVLLGLILIIGTVMIIVSPFGHTSWDVESHYKLSLEAGHIGTTYETYADSLVISNSDYYWPKETAAENIANINYMNNADQNVISESKYDFHLSHFPSGLFLALGKLFGLSFYYTNTLGKFGNLLVYAFCCYFAVKKLKSGKMILSVIALFPTNLFLATTYSYDFWVTGFVFLGMAYFLGERQEQDKPVSVVNTVVMCGSFALACLPKQIYAPLLIIPFLMSHKKIKNKKIYYSVCTISIVVLFALLIIRTFAEAAAGGDMRGGAEVSSTGQMKFILSNPVKYAGILIKFLLEYLSVGNMSNYITNFAYLGIGSGAVVFIILMLAATFTDKNEYDLKASGWFVRTVNVLLYFGCSALVATALYIAFTAVGSDTILGCQPRYIIPLLYPLLSVIGYNGFTNKINRTLYNYAILIPCCAVIFYNVYNMMVLKWM